MLYNKKYILKKLHIWLYYTYKSYMLFLHQEIII